MSKEKIDLDKNPVCGCGDSHCDTCNPNGFVYLQAVRAGIDHAKEQLKPMGEDGVRVETIAQIAASKAIEYYKEHSK